MATVRMPIVDEHRVAMTPAVAQQVVEQGGLAGPDDGERDLLRTGGRGRAFGDLPRCPAEPAPGKG